MASTMGWILFIFRLRYNVVDCMKLFNAVPVNLGIQPIMN